MHYKKNMTAVILEAETPFPVRIQSSGERQGFRHDPGL